MKYNTRQRGVGHIGAIVAIIVVVALAGVGWFVYSKNNGPALTPEQQAVQDALKNAKCDYDKDLCKFFVAYKAQPYVTIHTTSKTDDGTTTTMTLQKQGANKAHLTIEGENGYEIIAIDKTTYTKAPNGTWWKQTAEGQGSAAGGLAGEQQVEFAEPTTDAQKAAYKKIGIEACGQLQCLKYQQTESGYTSTLWFDDKDYQLRRTVTESANLKSDATYSYERVDIAEPTPAKELAPGQYILPGQNEPTALPGTGDSAPTPEELQQLVEQYR